MKVLLINNCHWLRGGSETVYFNTARLLVEAGHKVAFLSFEDEKNIHTDQPEYFVKRGNALKNMRAYFANGEAARLIEEVIKKEKPDIAHSHLMWGGMTAAIIPVLHKYGIPLVHTAHDYRMVCPAYLLKDGKGLTCNRCKCGRFYQCALNKCSKGNLVESLLMTLEMYYRNIKWHPAKMIDGFVFVSNFSRNKHIEFDESFKNADNEVIYNCPGEKVKDSLNDALDTYENYYLYYGRISAEKGLQTLIKAFESFPNLHLVIVGTGPLEFELKQYCKNNNLNNIEFLGYKTGKDLYDMVANAKYVCVPSECFENNPMTIVEAYSLGTPVIGADIGGISEIVLNERTGFLFKSGLIDSLIKSIKMASSVSKNQYDMQKKAAYDFGQENFSRERHIEKLTSLYNYIIGKGIK